MRARRGGAGALAAGLVGATLALSPAPALARRVLILPLEHPGLEAQVVEALERGLRTEVAGTLEDHALLPRPALELSALALAVGCAEVDRACLRALSRSSKARVLRLRVQRGGPSDTFEVWIADRQRVAPYRARVHRVDADSGPELRHHLAKALGVDRAPPPARLAPRAPLAADVEVRLDDAAVTREALEDVAPGPHRLELRGPSGETVVWTGHARPGRTVTFPVEGLSPPAAPPGGPRVAARASEAAPELVHTWWLGGAALLTLGVAVPVLGAEVEAQEAAVARAGLTCQGPSVPAPCQEGYDRATRANVALGVGLGLAVGAVVAFFAEDGPGWIEGLATRPARAGQGAGWALAGAF